MSNETPISATQPEAARVRTVLVCGEGETAQAVVSWIVARPIRRRRSRRLHFIGTATFAAATTRHIAAVILPLVDRISVALGLTPGSFELSVANVGAASSSDVGVCVSGYSADLAVFLALLSASIRFPLPADALATGHLASADGDISPVGALPAKLAAAAADHGIRRFVYPCIERDASMARLSPAESAATTAALAQARGHLELLPVANILELVEAIFDDHAVVLASLHQGFFEGVGPAEDEAKAVDGHVTHTVGWLAHGNEVRFWRVLENTLLNGKYDHARGLLTARLQYQIRRCRYPEGLGQRLRHLLASLPPAVRRLRLQSPVLQLNQCLEVARLAGASDHPDVQGLLDVVYGRINPDRPPVPANSSSAPPADGDASSAAVETVLAEIDGQTLTEKIRQPLDAARSCYCLDSVVIADYHEFCDTIGAFYLHLLRRVVGMAPTADSHALSADALALVEQAFARQGGSAGALAEAKEATGGGMRLVLDKMTEQLKQDMQTKHVSRVLKDALDPLDWDAKVRFMAALLHRLRAHIPPEIRQQPPERFARHYEAIVVAYVESTDKFREALRTY